MPGYSFKVGKQYSKNDIYRICDVPATERKGKWNTGYTQHRGDFFIFCNIGVPGKTGHDHPNRFEGRNLDWSAKKGAHLGQKLIREMVAPGARVHVFHRHDNNGPWTFAGLGEAVRITNSRPVGVLWGFQSPPDGDAEVLDPEVPDPQNYREGALRQIWVNAYERSREAREACLRQLGTKCKACLVDLGERYGEIGEGFIHVHHIRQLADIGDEYVLDPVADLVPVCPNCHAMLHRRRPPFSVRELRSMITRDSRCP